jgi:signal transduction protein with GAF and PtsI domain
MKQEYSCFFKPLYQVASVINSSLNPQVVLQRVVEEVSSAMKCKACTLRLLDRSGKFLLASASTGLSMGYLRKGQIDLTKSRVDAEVLSSNTPLYIKDITQDNRFQYPEAAKAEGIVSIMVAPLLVERKPVGILRIYTDTAREFSDEEKDFLMAVAHIAAISIENARLHESLRSDFNLLTQYNYQIFED